MISDIERKIGFDLVRSQVSSMCASSLGVSRCLDMTFSANPGLVRMRLSETAEMLSILQSDAAFPINNIHDCRKLLISLRIPGSFPSETDLPDLKGSLGAMAEISSFFSKLRRDDSSSPYPALDALAGDLLIFPGVSTAIDKIVDRHGEIKDNASPALSEIRRNMAVTAGSINSTMRRVIANAVRDGYLDADVTPSMRDGRLVLPVAPMYKRKISGIVHDESASGKTFFIEPAELVEANNRLRELSIEERHEIVRILTALADFIRPDIDDLLSGFELLGQFDFIYAKAKYAQATGGHMPNLSDRPQLEWYHACHPLLQQTLERQAKAIVPLDIALSEKNRILIISGPNAGGKSVTLKTVALIQYMIQSGLLPTMYDNSHAGIFSRLFIDIGDDQSIEDDLSTYSSHLRNMKRFLKEGDSDTLILIDEFGGGTEPQIGGAIAQAVLHNLNSLGVWGIITTHYHNLKQFAEETDGLINGSMLYDRQKMMPMFRLAIGQPGSSFAIEIARNTGLPDSIINEAKEIVGSDYINMDRYLLDIARDRRYWERKRDSIRLKEKQLEDTLSKYEAEMESLKTKRREIIGDAKQEAQKLLENSNAMIERTIREIRTSQADKEKTKELRARFQAEKEELSKSDAKTSHPLLEKKLPRRNKNKAENKTQVKKVDNQNLAPGDNVVLIDGGGTVGTIENISGKTATVVFGQVKTTVKLERLKKTIRKASSGAGKSGLVTESYLSSHTSDSSRERQLSFSNEIDVRGMRTDEAVQAVMYYIDDAIQFNSSRVRILHGTGTGALREYIRRYLATVPGISNYHDEDVRFGGPGITVVEF